jgi:hypothetical protein
VGISYWRLKDRTTFRLRPGQAQLSNEVVGEILNLEHREMKGDRLWVMLKADKDIKYSDGHHQLENVYLEVYPDQGDRPDKISARQTLTNEDNTQRTSPRPSASSAGTSRAAPTRRTSTRRRRSSTSRGPSRSPSAPRLPPPPRRPARSPRRFRR